MSAATTFSFGSGMGVGQSNAAALQNVTNSSLSVNQNSATMVVEYFDDIFPGIQLWNKISPLAEESCIPNDAGIVAGQQLLGYITSLSREDGTGGSLLFNPKSVQYRNPDEDVRRRLSQNPYIVIKNSNRKQIEASLTRQIYDDVCHLADSLYISEVEAFSLYYYVSQNPDSMIDNGRMTLTGNTVGNNSNESRLLEVARELFFFERSCFLKTQLLLLKLRRNSTQVAYISDFFLQNGLINSLVQLVRDHTLNIHILRENDNLRQRLQFTLQERQTASECLFFAAYDVQLTAEEVVSIIDLIRDLTNGLSNHDIGLRKLHPLRDVPNTSVLPTEAVGVLMPRSPFSETVRVKDPLEWQRELVETVHTIGMPSLLRCVGVLIMSCICALDSQNMLVDRMTHSTNEFGKGNALLSPDSPNLETLKVVESRLNTNAVNNWKRPDVFGLLTAAYSMLLGSSLHAGSTRLTVDSLSVSITKTLRELLTLSSQLKSFTFGRFSLIPAIRKPVVTGVMAEPSFDTSSFLLSSLAEFASKFLEFLCTSGALPVSRAKWDESVQDYQQMQREYEEQQRAFQGQFRVTSESNASAASTAADVPNRPDCMDDLIAFAASVCAFGSDYSLRFWSVTNKMEASADVTTDMELRPSLALQILCGQQSKDDSLRSAYLSFISVLALAKSEDASLNGSESIDELFTGKSSIVTGYNENWASLFETLRHYVRELNPNAYSTIGATGNETKARNIEGTSTSYYYIDDDSTPYNDPSTRLDQSRNLKSRGGSKELGEENTAIVLAHLAVISNVAKNCAGSRLRILSTLLPIHRLDHNDVVGHDDALNILFTLSIMPLRPEVRGAVFRTLAALLSPVGLSDDESVEMRLMTSRSWDLLYTCQVVPTNFLGKYDSDQNALADARGINFSPSALVLASSTAEGSIIPSDHRYSLLYEMEYIESALGFYPSSEGFMRLLSSLFTASPTLRNQQGGSTPYAEYICSFVIPRATGRFMNLPRLPFRIKEDFYRLMAHAFDALSCVLKSYNLGKVGSPSIMSNKHVFKTTRNESLLVLGSELLTECVTTCSHAQDEATSYHDFDATKDVVKSPGFTVMRDLMSFSNGNIVFAVADTFRRSGHQHSNVESDRFATAHGMYGEVSPTWASLKENASQRSWPRIRLTPIFPVDFFEVANWEETAVSSALRLLCAGIARERLWNQSIQQVGPRLRTAPYMNFARLSVNHAVEEGAGRISHEMFRVDAETNFIDNLIDIIAISHRDDVSDSFIALAASCVLFFLDQSLGQNQNKDTFYSPIRAHRVAATFNRRILLSAAGEISPGKRDLLKLIVEKIVTPFRTTRLESPISMVLIGMPFPETATTIRHPNSLTERKVNCIDALLKLLNNSSFVGSDEGSNIAAIGYEILFYVISTGDGDVRLLLDDRLQNCNFWSLQVAIMSSLLQQDVMISPQILHCASWFLKCACSALISFVSGSDTVVNSGGLVHPQLFQFSNFYLSLFKLHGIVDLALGALPLEKPVVARPTVNINESFFLHAKKSILGSEDVVQGYAIIDADILFEGEVESENNKHVKSWVGQLNWYVEVDCAASHLTYSIYLAVGALAQLWNSRMLPYAEMDSIPSDLLSMILQKFEESVESFDDKYFETATRNLALIARMALFGTSSTKTSLGNVVSTYNSLSKVIVRSRTIRSDEAIIETIACWACSLAFILKSTSGEAILSEYPGELVEAASMLLSFISHLLSARSKSIKSTNVRAITATLSAILDFFVDSSEQVSTMVLKQMKNDIKTAVSLLPVSTDHMPLILTQIAMLPRGTHLLFELDIVSSLTHVAETYFRAESKSLASLSQQSSVSEQIQIRIPHFLTGHFKIMNAMLVSGGQDEYLNSMRLSFVSVIKQYRQVVERLFHHFPVDKDAIHEVLKCILLLKSSQQLPLPIDNTFNLGVNGAEYELRIVRYLFHVIEYPLPLSLLPSIPSMLDENLRLSVEDAVNISMKKGVCWWDRLDLEPYNGVTSLSTEIVANAAEALDSARMALTIVRGSNTMFQLHVSSYCRALCRCVAAIRLVEATALHAKRNGVIIDDDAPRDYFEEVQRNLVEIIASLLSWITVFVRQTNLDNSHAIAIQVALDYCDMDVQGLNRMTEIIPDENDFDNTIVLTSILRQELKAWRV